MAIHDGFIFFQIITEEQCLSEVSFPIFLPAKLLLLVNMSGLFNCMSFSIMKLVFSSRQLKLEVVLSWDTHPRWVRVVIMYVEWHIDTLMERTYLNTVFLSFEIYSLHQVFIS